MKLPTISRQWVARGFIGGAILGLITVLHVCVSIPLTQTMGEITLFQKAALIVFALSVVVLVVYKYLSASKKDSKNTGRVGFLGLSIVFLVLLTVGMSTFTDEPGWVILLTDISAGILLYIWFKLSEENSGDDKKKDTKKDEKKKDKEPFYIPLFVFLGLVFVWIMGLILLDVIDLSDIESVIGNARQQPRAVMSSAPIPEPVMVFEDLEYDAERDALNMPGWTVSFICDDPSKACDEMYKGTGPEMMQYPIATLRSTHAGIDVSAKGVGCAINESICDTWTFVGTCINNACTGGAHHSMRDPALGDMGFSFTWKSSSVGRVGIGRIPELNVQFFVRQIPETPRNR